MNQQADIRATAPDLAPSSLEQRPGGGFEGLTPRRFVVEWLALTVLMAAGYLALGALGGSIAMLAVAVAYAMWLYLGYRKLPKRPKLSQPAERTQLYAVLYTFGGGFAFVGFMATASLAWLWAAYDHPWVTGLLAQIGWIAIGLLLFLLLLTAAVYLGPLVLMRREGALSGRLRDFIRRDITRPIQSPHWLAVADAMAIAGLLTTAAGALAFEGFANAINMDRGAGILDAVRMFPVLLIKLPAAAALLVIFLGSFFREQGDRPAPLVQSHLQGGPGLAAWKGWAAAGASLLLAFTILYTIHIGLVAAASPAPGIRLAAAADKAVRDWIAAARDKGLDAKEIAARLNRHGRWSPGAPEAGLGALQSELGAKLAEIDGRCEIAVAAGSAGTETTYCIRATCPSPVTWQAPPPLALSTSHQTENLYWMERFYFDVFADGVAAAPGGYCTADGRLAAGFQG